VNKLKEWKNWNSFFSAFPESMNKPEGTTMSKNEYYILKDGCTDNIIVK